MATTIRIDLHCHSDRSDGMLSPREVALMLAEDRVVAASLTDHDTVSGQADFAEAAADLGLAAIPGVELAVQYREGEAHLLGYGLAPERFDEAAERAVQAVRAGVLHWDARAGIDFLHGCGGLAFLAHPHMLENSLEGFRDVLTDLRRYGLDGVEAYYGIYTPAQRVLLGALAEDLDLLVSGGSDAHERREGGGPDYGVEMPLATWERFLQALRTRQAAPR